MNWIGRACFSTEYKTVCLKMPVSTFCFQHMIADMVRLIRQCQKDHMGQCLNCLYCYFFSTNFHTKSNDETSFFKAVIISFCKANNKISEQSHLHSWSSRTSTLPYMISYNGFKKVNKIHFTQKSNTFSIHPRKWNNTEEQLRGASLHWLSSHHRQSADSVWTVTKAGASILENNSDPLCQGTTLLLSHLTLRTKATRP